MPVEERFTRFSTTAEQQFLTGARTQPPTPAERCAPRAPYLVPAPGAGRSVARHQRIWADQFGAVWTGDRGGDGVRVPAGTVVAAAWVVDAGQQAVGLAPSRTGCSCWSAPTGRCSPLRSTTGRRYLPIARRRSICCARPA